VEFLQLLGHRGHDLGAAIGILLQKRHLAVGAGMTAGRQQKMTFQEGFTFLQNFDCFSRHDTFLLYVHSILYYHKLYIVASYMNKNSESALRAAADLLQILDAVSIHPLVDLRRDAYTGLGVQEVGRAYLNGGCAGHDEF